MGMRGRRAIDRNIESQRHKGSEMTEGLLKRMRRENGGIRKEREREIYFNLYMLCFTHLCTHRSF